MKNKLPIYQLLIDDSDFDNTKVNYVALVDMPAIESNWIAFQESNLFGGPGSGRTPEDGAGNTDEGEITTASIDKAAEDDRFKSAKKNGTAIEKTLDALTGRGSQVNYDIREGKETEAGKAFISNVDKSLNSLPDYKGIVYRGINDNNGNILKSLNDSIGGTVQWKGYTHSTKDESRAHTFGKGVIFTITSKTGKNIENYSQIKSEKEVVFKRDSKYRIDKIDGKNVHITEI